MTAEDHKTVVGGKALGAFLIEKSAARRHVYGMYALAFTKIGGRRRVASVNRRSRHKHAAPASVRSVVNTAVTVSGVVAYVVAPYIEDSRGARPADYAFRQHGVYKLREQRHYIHSHSEEPFLRRRISPSFPR